MALPTSIELQIVTPERLLLKEQVDEVEIPGSEGYFGVLPGHTPLLASLTVGELWYRKGQEKTYLLIAEAARKRAEERLTQQSEVDYERARFALMKSMTRLQVSARIGVGPRTGGMKRLRNQS
jgi:F-type H+-transporting ATPase subunit epsilon